MSFVEQQAPDAPSEIGDDPTGSPAAKVVGELPDMALFAIGRPDHQAPSRGAVRLMAMLLISIALHAGGLALFLFTAPPVADQPETLEIPVEMIEEGQAVPERIIPLPEPPPEPDLRIEPDPPPVVEAAKEPDPPPAPEPEPPPVEPEPPREVARAVEPAPPPPEPEVRPDPPPEPEAPPPPPPEPVAVVEPVAPPEPIPPPPEAVPPPPEVVPPPPVARQPPPRPAPPPRREEPRPPPRQPVERRPEPRPAPPPARPAVERPAPPRVAAPAPPRPAAPPPAASAAAIGAWKSGVASRIAGNKSYPESARARSAGGTAIVSLSISPSGGLAGASVSKSSGHADLDAAALSAVRRASPFPPPPPGAPRSFAVPFSFAVR